MMRLTPLLAVVLIGAASGPAAAQATLPRTGPTWTYPNGFGQRWITPVPGRGFSTAPGFPSGRILHIHPGPWYGHRYSFAAPVARYPGFGAAPGGHIYFYYGPGLSYRHYPAHPYFPHNRVYNPSPTACWF